MLHCYIVTDLQWLHV